MFNIIKAAITPGIQPQIVSISTIIIEPHPLSNTARGGNKIDNSTLQILINFKVKINIQLISTRINHFVTAIDLMK